MPKYRPMKRLLCLSTILCFAGSLLADESGPGIYRSKDKRGHTVFTDQHSDDAERIELQDTNRTPALVPRPRASKAKPKGEGSGYRVEIVQPANNSVVPSGLVPTQVSVNIDPPLLPKHRVQFLLDGESLLVSSSQQHTIKRLKPGSHQISVRVVDADGESLGEAGAVTVTAYWPGNR
ncbi:MAG: hypothetical protein ACI9OO_000376 [Bacteroidia bacterium]